MCKFDVSQNYKLTLMKNLKILSGLLIIFLIFSCGRDRCGFPDKDLHWVPYEENNILTYTDLKDTIKLSVAIFNKTGSFYTSFIIMDPDPCYDSAYYITTKDILTGYLINETYNLIYEPKMEMQITKNDMFIFDPDFYVGGSEYLADNYVGDSIKVNYHSDTIIFSQNYQNVYKLFKDTLNHKPKISWLIKSTTKGIIAFYDYSTKKTWHLINNK